MYLMRLRFDDLIESKNNLYNLICSITYLRHKSEHLIQTLNILELNQDKLELNQDIASFLKTSRTTTTDARLETNILVGTYFVLQIGTYQTFRTAMKKHKRFTN